MFANLISISQLCDQGFRVQFSKDNYEVLDSGKNVVMIRTQISDNYYPWDNKLKCNLVKSNETMLWPKRLGHISISKICKTINWEVVHGVSLKQNNNIQCLECPVGKQIKSSQRTGDHIRTNRVLKLLRLDILGPM